MASTSLEILLTAKDEATAVLKGAGDQAESTGAKWKDAAVKFAALGAAAGTVTGLLADASRAGLEEDAAIRTLALAAKNAGADMDGLGASIEDQISKWQALTGIQDGKLRPALTNLINETGSLEEAMTRMPLAMDIAAGAHIDLETATRLLGKVTDENINVFKRMGLTFDKNATQQEVLTALTAKFAGQAVAAKKPTDDFHNAIADFQEDVGHAIGPFSQYIALLPGLTSGISLATTAIFSMVPALVSLTASLWAAIAPALVAAAPFLAIGAAIALVVVALWQIYETVKVVYDNWDKVMYLMGKAFSALWETVQGVAEGFVKIGSDIVEGLWSGISRMTGWMQEKIRGFVNLIPSAVRDLLGIHSPSRVFAEIGSEIPAGLAAGIDGNAGAATGAISRLGTAIAGTMTATIGAIGADSLAILQRMGLASGSSTSSFSDGVAENVSGVGRVLSGSEYDDTLARIVANNPNLPAYATGTPYVPRDGLAYLHKGEAVVPASQNGGAGIDYDRLAAALSAVRLSIGIDDIYSALLKYGRSNGALGLG